MGLGNERFCSETDDQTVTGVWGPTEPAAATHIHLENSWGPLETVVCEGLWRQRGGRRVCDSLDPSQGRLCDTLQPLALFHYLSRF